jgi:hypothetical protein
VREELRIGHALLRLAAVAGALLMWLAPTGAHAGAATKQERWIAVRAGRPAAGVHVIQRGRGYCFTGSLADPRTDAWRCLLGNEIQDPCFSGGSGFVVCPDGTPDSRDALRLQLTKPLPHSRANPPGDPTRKAPWVIVTAGGAYCYRMTGARDIAAGRALTYECAGAAALAGSPNRMQQTWTIGLLATAAAKRYVTTVIASAWW